MKSKLGTKVATKIKTTLSKLQQSSAWQNRQRRKQMCLAGIVFVLCLGLVVKWQLGSSTTRTNVAANGKNQTTTVDVMTVEASDLLKKISLTGQIVPEAQVDIAAKYQGRVVAVNAALGQAVTAGQVLVVQDTGDADISLAQNQAAYEQSAAESVTTEATFNANLEKAKAAYQTALNSYRRNQTLYGVGGISREAFDTSTQLVADAKAALDTLMNQIDTGVAAAIQSSQAATLKAQHTIRAAEKQRADLILQAPRDGIIGYRLVEAGDIVAAGQKLLSLYDMSKLYVDCQISEQDLGAISLGMPVNVQIESLGKTFPGNVIYISPANDSQTMTFSLRIALLQPEPTVRTGMFTRTIVQTPLRQKVLTVAKDALQEKNGTSYVFVVKADNTLEQRNVQIGARGDQSVEILSGLQAGEQVAVNNLARLRAGMTVVVNAVSAPESRGQGL